MRPDQHDGKGSGRLGWPSAWKQTDDSHLIGSMPRAGPASSRMN